MYKSLRLKDSEPLYTEGGFGVYKFENQEKGTLLLTWEQAILLITTEGYKYIPFYQ